MPIDLRFLPVMMYAIDGKKDSREGPLADYDAAPMENVEENGGVNDTLHYYIGCYQLS